VVLGSGAAGAFRQPTPKDCLVFCPGADRNAFGFFYLLGAHPQGEGLKLSPRPNALDKSGV
jgi:hypothetical protein